MLVQRAAAFVDYEQREQPRSLADLIQGIIRDDEGDFLRIAIKPDESFGALIKKHRAAFAKEAPFWRFVHANMSDASIVELGAYDLIIAREVFFHVPESFVLAALRNFQRTGSRWLMATHNPTFVKTSNNDSAVRPVHGYVLGEGGVRHLNLRLPPYNLPAPRLELTELVVRGRGYAPKDTGNRMAMWKLEELRV